MKYLSQAYIYLVIFGEDFSPHELTGQISIEPTDFGIKGEKRKSGAILKECFWKYQLNSIDALEGLEESLQKLVGIFNNKVASLKDYIIRNELKSKCCIVIKSQNGEDTGVVLNSDFINFLHMLDISIEINVYSQA